MPVDILKIDRSFVREVDLDRDAASMVSAMIALADNLGMTPLAEGIETEGEWRFLADRGCALGQGYFFSRPVPASRDPRSASAGVVAGARRRRRLTGSRFGHLPSALRTTETRATAPRAPAEDGARRRDLHALLLELRVQIEACGHPAHVAELLRGHEGDARACASSPSRSSHAMHVSLVILRRVVVHDERDVVEVEAPAATSVAINTPTCLSSNRCSAFSRACCVMSPCIGDRWHPFVRS